MNNKVMLIKASTKAPIKAYTCPECSAHLLASVDSGTPYCPDCGFKIEAINGEAVNNAKISASSEKPIKVVCNDCKSHVIVSNTDYSTDSFCTQKFCTVCGSGDLLSEEEFNESSSKDDEDIFAGIDSVDDDLSDDIEMSDDVTDSTPSNEDIQDSTEEDVQDTLDSEGETTDPDDLQWLATEDEENGDNGTLIACTKKDGLPLFYLRKNECPQEMQPFFATTTLTSAFSQIARKEGMLAAVQKFNGKAFSKKKIINTIGLQASAYDHLQKNVLPKLVECMAIAVEGGTKGIFPDVMQPLQASFMQEMMANGLPEDKAFKVCNDALVQNPTVFSAIVAKALELLKKSPETYEELRATVRSSVGLQATTIYDSEQVKVRSALQASTPNLTIGNSSTSILASMQKSHEEEINELRSRLRLGRRR